MHLWTMHQSDEVYILKKYSWLVLSNQDNIDYSQEMKVDSHFRYFMTLYDKEEKLFDLVPELREMRDQKELYIRFNKAHFEDMSEVKYTLSKLIEHYRRSRFEMFRNFAALLKENYDEILNSFELKSLMNMEKSMKRDCLMDRLNHLTASQKT